MSVVDPISIFIWIVFYLFIIGLFYWCFRQSMMKLANQSTRNQNQFDDVERPISLHRHRAHRHGRRHHHRPNGRHPERVLYGAGHGHNVYFITESGRESNASSDVGLQMQPPPEYKWEDLPPTYDEAVHSFTNTAFSEDEPIPGTSYVEESNASSSAIAIGSQEPILDVPSGTRDGQVSAAEVSSG